MTRLTDEQMGAALGSERYAALRRLGIGIGDLIHWDDTLDRDPRLLVPVDVQALVVREGDDEAMVRLPLRDRGDPVPSIDDPGTARAPGVHLMWAVPEALGRGRLVDDPDDPDPEAKVLELPLMPDRWVVLRLVVATGERGARLRGWVVEADAGTVTPLSDWPDERDGTVEVAPPIPADRLDVQAGGPSWTSCYDAALGRLALHDPLDGLVDGSLDGVEGDAVTYVVAGWWSSPANDPLSGVGSLEGFWERLASLGWDDVDHPADHRTAAAEVQRARDAAEDVGIGYSASLARKRGGASFDTTSDVFVDGAKDPGVLPLPPTRATLLHGRIHGIPLRAGRPDNRPEPDEVGVAIATSAPELTATLASKALADDADPDERRDLERLVAGLGAGLLPRMSQADMWSEIEHYEHRHAFGSLPGGTEAVDRFVPAPPKPADPRRSGAPRPRRTKGTGALDVSKTILWSSTERPAVIKAAEEKLAATRRARKEGNTRPVSVDQPDFRSVTRAAPRFHVPTAPVLAVYGAGRQRSAVERDEADGVLRCRTSDQVSEGLRGVLEAADLLPSVGSGAVPDELRLLAREALASDPHLVAWRARVGDSGSSASSGAVLARVRAEAAVNYAYYAGDNERLESVVRVPVVDAAARQLAVEQLLRFSADPAVWAHGEGVTMWGQPWRPVFCEWELDVELAPPRGWELGEADLDPTDALPETTETVTVTGRSPVADGVASSLQAAVDRWLGDERARDVDGRGLASGDVERAIAGLTGTLSALDLQSVALDGVRERLLGLVYDRGLVRDDRDRDDGGRERTRADGPPRPVVAGRATVRRARLVDAFGRLLDLRLEGTRVPVRDAAEPPASLRLRPRISAPARLHLRLVDPLAAGADAETARVDQTVPDGGVNPIAGFLLPDHIDEALEVFDPSGAPLGQLFHDGFSGAVTWEGAPGRTDVGPGAGPLDDGVPAHRRVGWIAAGLVVRDAEARGLSTVRPEEESSLAAMLHAIDTTLWTVDPFGSLGREYIAGLVGRPIAVVTAQLTLDVLTDLDDHVYVGTTREERERAFRELASTAFDVRLGAVTRADDGLLGYYVDDDYSLFHVVDRVVAEQDLLGAGPIRSRYIVPDGTVTIRYGQTLRLTLLMHPGGRVHLTSGILPRQAVSLSRDWVQPGLSRIAPSARVGPLLVDVDKVRLPKVAAFPADQLFTRRDSPSSWREDPIVSATHTAYLPDQASVVQEGWIRIAPDDATASERDEG